MPITKSRKQYFRRLLSFSKKCPPPLSKQIFYKGAFRSQGLPLRTKPGFAGFRYRFIPPFHFGTVAPPLQSLACEKRQYLPSLFLLFPPTIIIQKRVHSVNYYSLSASRSKSSLLKLSFTDCNVDVIPAL